MAEYINLTTASKQARVSIQTLRRDIKINKLKALKVGRSYVLTEKDFKNYLQDRYNTTDLKTIEKLKASL